MELQKVEGKVDAHAARTVSLYAIHQMLEVPHDIVSDTVHTVLNFESVVSDGNQLNLDPMCISSLLYTSYLYYISF